MCPIHIHRNIMLQRCIHKRVKGAQVHPVRMYVSTVCVCVQCDLLSLSIMA